MFVGLQCGNMNSQNNVFFMYDAALTPSKCCMYTVYSVQS